MGLQPVLPQTTSHLFNLIEEDTSDFIGIGNIHFESLFVADAFGFVVSHDDIGVLRSIAATIAFLGISGVWLALDGALT